MTVMWQGSDSKAFSLAKSQAQKSFDEGGLPIGSTLVDHRGEIIGAGHNQRVQLADPTAHAGIPQIAPYLRYSRHVQCVRVQYFFSRSRALS